MIVLSVSMLLLLYAPLVLYLENFRSLSKLLGQEKLLYKKSMLISDCFRCTVDDSVTLIKLNQHQKSFAMEGKKILVWVFVSLTLH